MGERVVSRCSRCGVLVGHRCGKLFDCPGCLTELMRTRRSKVVPSFPPYTVPLSYWLRVHGVRRVA